MLLMFLLKFEKKKKSRVLRLEVKRNLYSREFFPIESSHYRKERSVLDEITDREVSILDLILVLTIIEIRESEISFRDVE